MTTKCRRCISPALALAAAIAHSCFTAAGDVAAQPRDPVQNCFSIDECKALLISREAKESGDGISFEEDSIALSFRKLGRDGVPVLFELLQSEHENTRDVAAYTLSCHPDLTEADLGMLKKSMSTEMYGGWLPPAVARIGTPEAIELLVAELRRVQEVENQIGAAFETLGARGVPSLVRIIDGATDQDEKLLGAVAKLFAELGDKGKGAIPDLLRIAKDSKKPRAVRLYAVRSLGGVGVAARQVDTALHELSTGNDKEMNYEITEALAGIQSPLAVQGLLGGIDASSGDSFAYRRLYDLAEMGPAAHSAGPQLVKYLAGDNRDLRVYAAMTLGFIGYHESTSALRKALFERTDWRLNYAAIKSLGRLRSSEATGDLQTIKDQHWYPPVRTAAAEALANEVGMSSEASSTTTARPFMFQYSEYVESSYHLPPCDLPEGVNAPKKLRVSGGELIGTDEGEWVGSLKFVRETGSSTETLLKENVKGLVARSDEIFVFTGLAHMTLNQGRVYRALRGSDGRWRVVVHAELPGAPNGIVVLPAGVVVVGTSVWLPANDEEQADQLTTAIGGLVQLSNDGTLSMYSCPSDSDPALPRPPPLSTE